MNIWPANKAPRAVTLKKWALSHAAAHTLAEYSNKYFTVRQVSDVKVQ